MEHVADAAQSGIIQTSLDATVNAAAPVTISALTTAVPETASSSWMWSIFSLLSFVVYALQRIVVFLLTFTTYTLPTSTFSLFSMTLTFTLNFTTLCAILIAFASAVTWVVRYRYLNIYAQLPPEPQRQAPEIDLPPDSLEGDSKPGLSNYLDEFLSAIKIFGYLERPVFHELTRHMQTRKLIAGETFLLEEEKGFCLVVDGLVQIFTKANKEQPNRDLRPTGLEDYGEDAEYDDGSHGYQLLTEVKNGAPMSSLFTILSLFTEEVSLRRADSEENSEWGLSSDSVHKHPAGGYREREGFTPEGSERPTPDFERQASGLSSVPPFSLTDEADGYHGDVRPGTPQTSYNARPQRPKLKKMHSVHPDIVARASVDTTIAVIPAAAFRRLTRVYPKASAHIVQVILTRFQRVTFLTAYSYLGLTSEVLRTEKLMSYYTTYALPNDLRGGALDRLKEKFARERERSKPDEDETKGIALHNPHLGKRRRRSSATLRKEVAIHARLAATKRTPTTPLDGPTQSPMSSRPGYPGDLETSTPFKAHQPNPFGQGWTTSQPNVNMAPNPNIKHREFAKLPEPTPHNEDSAFREAVLDCMFKALGLNSKEITRPRTGTESGEQSPRLLSYDAKRQKAVFSNAFGFIDPYEGSHDETESQASTGTSYAGGLSSVQEELKDDVEIVFFPKDAVLVEQGDRCPGLYYVLDGFLEATIPVDEKSMDKSSMFGSADSGMIPPDDLPPLTRTTTNSSTLGGNAGNKKRKVTRKSLYMVKPGGVAGYMGSISAYRSFIDVRAKTDVYVGFIPRSSLERIVEKYPVVLLTMAKRLTSLLPRLILHIDFALEWLQVNAGQVVYHQSDESDAIYIVLNGRMRAISEDKKGNMQVVGEYGQGESVGELEVLTESERPATLHAIRDTEIAKFPKTLFNSLALEHPGITIQISKIIASRMRSLMDMPTLDAGPTSLSVRKIRPTVNPRTVCILPITSGVPVTEFSHRLSSALQQTAIPGGVVLLNQTAILNHLGRHAFNRMGKLKLSGYLADLEEKYGMVLYVCDTNVNAPWTQTCISQADCILLVGLAEASPAIGEYEKFLLGMKTTARKDLVLLHTERYCSAGLTRRWLKNRMWITGGHHHIQMAFRTTPEPTHVPGSRIGFAIKQRVQELQAEITKYTSRRVGSTPQYSSETPFKGDFHRLARRLCGKAIGLVLGGGGARGIAHVGVIRALEESGIPIDIVGGTSIGAFVGALYARDADIVSVYGRAKKFAGRMSSMWRFLLDLTYPTVSYTTGHEFNRGIFKTFRNSQIEDFWLEFYCNTTNISHSRQEIHTSGYAWRYIRASMSLAGLLPPLCDEGSMLLDGGYVDNLTVAHMRTLGAETIFAVDVGSIDDTTPQKFGDSLSGFWASLNRWNPFSPHPNPPTLAEIQARLAYVASVDALEKAKNTPGVLYMRPPIDAYGTLDFARFDEICEVGWNFAKGFLESVREEGGLEGLRVEERVRREMRRTMAPRRASI